MITHDNFHNTMDDFRGKWLLEIKERENLERIKQLNIYNESVNINWHFAPIPILKMILVYVRQIEVLDDLNRILDIMNSRINSDIKIELNDLIIYRKFNNDMFKNNILFILKKLKIKQEVNDWDLYGYFFKKITYDNIITRYDDIYKVYSISLWHNQYCGSNHMDRAFYIYDCIILLCEYWISKVFKKRFLNIYKDLKKGKMEITSQMNVGEITKFMNTFNVIWQNFP